MIVVTGATGQLGHLIVEKLLARTSPSELRATTRDPSKAADLSALGVEVRAADFADPSTLRDALEGARQVLIVSSNAAATGGDPLAQHRAAIDAARAAGAERIVYTSHMGASATSAFPPMRDHAVTEAMLAGSGTPWTSLRNGFYGGSALMMLKAAIESGALETAGDGAVSWTAHADLAEAAAILLTTARPFEGPTPPLTASDALSFADLAALASSVHGKSIVHRTLSDEAMRAKLPPRAVPMVLGLYTAVRDGEFAAVDPTLATLLERAPITMRELMTDAARG